jgi:ABC-type transport system involved in cytochrome c biogenesis permease subunit
MKKYLLPILFVFQICLPYDFSYKDLPIQQSGRIKPLDTYARTHLLQFYGKQEIKILEQDIENLTAIDWLYLVLSDPENELDRKIFNIRNPEVAFSLGLEKNDNHKYSFKNIIEGFQLNQELLEALKIKSEEEQTLVEKQVVEIYQNILAYDDIAHSAYCLLPLIEINNSINREFMGINDDKMLSYSFFMRNIGKFKVLLEDLLATEENDWKESHYELSKIAMQLQAMTKFHYAQSLKIIPGLIEDEWLSPWELMDGRELETFQKEILNFYENLFYAYVSKNNNSRDSLSTAIVYSIDSNIEDININLLNKETKYNSYDIFLWSMICYLVSFFLIGISWMIKPLLLRKISLSSMALGFLLHTYGIIMRMIIMQRPPVSTLYESILFVGFILVLFALIFEFFRKDTLGILVATIGGVILHFIGFKYAADGDTLGVLVAVLNSNFWLSTHVTTITTGYGVSIVAGLMAHIYLVLCIIKPKNKKMLDKVFNNTYGLTLMGLFFTMFGTILGGIWADQSWGRFWGWDPKENGALLIVLWHLMMLHLRVSGLVGRIGYAYGVCLVNIIVAIAWFGVNLLNVGLHSYGFTDNVATNLFLFIFFEIAFTSILYFFAKRSKSLI